MEAKVKRTTDNVENLIKELEKQYVDNKPDKKEIKPSKYDEGTGTFYVDEELAKTKMEKKKIPETVKKEEKDLSIDDMLKLFVKEDDEKKPVKKVFLLILIQTIQNGIVKKVFRPEYFFLAKIRIL